jgi:hypothetical protein
MNWLNGEHRLDPEARQGRAIRIGTALIVVLWSLAMLLWLPAS